MSKTGQYGWEGEFEALGWLVFCESGKGLNDHDKKEMIRLGFMTEDGEPTPAAFAEDEKNTRCIGSRIQRTS